MVVISNAGRPNYRRATRPTSGSVQLGFQRGLAGEVARLHPRDPVDLTLAPAYPGFEHGDVFPGLYACTKW